MGKYLSSEKNIELVLDLLKAHRIRKVVASPGATNTMIVASMQADGNFEIFSSVDERSAAYIACGMAEESGEPIVLSCTGATASRNYYPGLTEAYYRKLPIIVITSSQNNAFQGHLYQQLTDRSQYPSDIFVAGEQIQYIKDEVDYWDCENKINKIILASRHRGGGPVHLNVMNNRHDVIFRKTKQARVIKRITLDDEFPTMPQGKIGIWITSHKPFSKEEELAIDNFAGCHNAVVFCDHTSNYYGKYRVDYALIGAQKSHIFDLAHLDLLIHIGEMTGDYPTSKSLSAKQIWRISEDGCIRVKLDVLNYIFEMNPIHFFQHYTGANSPTQNNFLDSCQAVYKSIYDKIPDTLPFCNIWIAKTLAPYLPQNSVIHLGILNSLRSWNLFRLPYGVRSNSNVGGFGIDGCMSSLIGASFIHPDRLYFGVVGDLAFFYDLNSLGNRHITKNVRIILINNGLGGEFKLYSEIPGITKEEYICAAGHYGMKSKSLVKHYAEDLGFEYISASDKEEFISHINRFTRKEVDGKPMIFEVFEEISDQKEALEIITNLAESNINEKLLMNTKSLLKDKTSFVKKLFK